MKACIQWLDSQGGITNDRTTVFFSCIAGFSTDSGAATLTFFFAIGISQTVQIYGFNELR